MSNVAAEDVPGLVALARAEQVDLTIVGPEAPLVIGVVDEFDRAGLKCFGPRRAPAQLEGSKAFTKEFLRRHGIPTASYATFTRETFDRGLRPSPADTDRRQGQRPRCRQRCRHRRHRRRGDRNRAKACSPDSSATPGRWSSSRSSCRARKPASSSWPTASTSSRSRPPRITSDSLDGGSGTQHRRHGRVLTGSGRH